MAPTGAEAGHCASKVKASSHSIASRPCGSVQRPSSNHYHRCCLQGLLESRLQRRRADLPRPDCVCPPPAFAGKPTRLLLRRTFPGKCADEYRCIPQHAVAAEDEPSHTLCTHDTVMAHVKRVLFNRNIPMHRRIRGELGRASLDLRVNIHRRLILPLRLPCRTDIKRCCRESSNHESGRIHTTRWNR